MEDTLTDREELQAPLRIDYKKLLYVLIIGVAVGLLLVKLVGEREALAVLQGAKTEFVVLAVISESLRYLAVALYNQKLLHFQGHHIGLWPFVELMLASGSANRIVSAGGMAGVYVRYRFFDKHGLSLGSLAIVLILQTCMTSIILFCIFLFGLFYLLSHRLLGTTQLLVTGAMICLVSGVLASVIVLYRRPRKVKSLLVSLTKLIDVPWKKLTRRGIYNDKEVIRNINNFYQAVDIARKNPVETGKAFVYSIMTLFADIFSLYFVFHALGFPIQLDVLLVGYAITNYIISLSLMPEGIGISELSLSAVYASMGVPAGIVVVATLLFRFISFWLPILVGLLTTWDLYRRSLL